MDKYQEIKMRSKMPEDVIKEVSDYIKVKWRYGVL